MKIHPFQSLVVQRGVFDRVSAVYTMLAAFSKSATNAGASVLLVGLELAMQGVGNQNVREVGVHPGEPVHLSIFSHLHQFFRLVLDAAQARRFFSVHQVTNARFGSVRMPIGAPK